MAFYDVVRFEGTGDDWLVYKHPVDEFNNKSRLIVANAEVAIVVHNGKIEKILEEGAYPINSELLPILKNFPKAFFGGKNPYPIEIYFINKRLKLDMLWGTADPIKMLDPTFHVEINVRARGQLGVRLANYQFFFQTLLGSMLKGNYVTFETIKSYFRGVMNQKVKQEISKFMIKQHISFFDVNAYLDEMQVAFTANLKAEFARFGFDLVTMSIESINIPDEDSKRLNDILHSRSEMELLGDAGYRAKRGYDVLDKGAANEGGMAGLFMGMGVGNVMGSQLQGGIIGGNNINGNQPQQAAQASFKCPKCGASIDPNNKFCPECGTKIVHECPNCHHEVDPSQKFCPECGTKLYE